MRRRALLHPVVAKHCFYPTWHDTVKKLRPRVALEGWQNDETPLKGHSGCVCLCDLRKDGLVSRIVHLAMQLYSVILRHRHARHDVEGAEYCSPKFSTMYRSISARTSSKRLMSIPLLAPSWAHSQVRRRSSVAPFVANAQD